MITLDYAAYAGETSIAWAQGTMRDYPRRTAGIRAVIRALAAAGDPVVAVNDGEYDVAVPGERAALVVAHGVDMAHLVTASGATVSLVMCNGDDVCDTIADWDATLTPIVSPILDRYDA